MLPASVLTSSFHCSRKPEGLARYSSSNSGMVSELVDRFHDHCQAPASHVSLSVLLALWSLPQKWFPLLSRGPSAHRMQNRARMVSMLAALQSQSSSRRWSLNHDNTSLSGSPLAPAAITPAQPSPALRSCTATAQANAMPLL